MTARSPARVPRLIVSSVCGHARIVKVRYEADVKAARLMRCNDCRLMDVNAPDNPFRGHETGMVPCFDCGVPRQIARAYRAEYQRALNRRCRACCVRRMTKVNAKRRQVKREIAVPMQELRAS